MSADLSLLHPKLQPLCLEFLRLCAEAGLTVKVTFTFRTPEQQDALYAQGRTAPGEIVTKVTSANSKHCFELNGIPASKAFDFAIYDNAGKYITDGKDPRYMQAGKIGESLGLVYGGDWPYKWKDYDHLQIT